MRFVALVLCLLVVAISAGQGMWSPAGSNSEQKGGALFQLNRFSLESMLSQPLGSGRTIDIELPRPDGTTAWFRAQRSRFIEPRLEASLGVSTFHIRGVSDPLEYGCVEVHQGKLWAYVRGAQGGSILIDPVPYRSGLYSVGRPTGVMGACGTTEDGHSHSSMPIPARTLSTIELKRYRLIIHGTAEFKAQNENPTGATVAMVDRARLILIVDCSIDLYLAQLHLFDDPLTDGYTSGTALFGENQRSIDAMWDPRSYDLGAVMSMREDSTLLGEVADLNIVGKEGEKAKCRILDLPDYPGLPQDPSFEVFAHEVGHMFGARHTMSELSLNFDWQGAVEPGDGHTIMSYGGGVDSFHVCSISFIKAWRDNPESDGERISIQNTNPSVSVQQSQYTIPADTPFRLSCFASDPDSNSQLTYSWECTDLGIDWFPPKWRSWPPNASPSRTFPRLELILHGGTDADEPLVGGEYSSNFRVTVRDRSWVEGGWNDPEGFCGGIATTDVRVVRAGSPFSVTYPNSPTTWEAGTQQTVYWFIGGGNVASNVRILLSTDGGYSYDGPLSSDLIELVASTPNDGVQTVSLPAIPPTSRARIIIEAVGNIFFDVSDEDFTITAASAPHINSISPTSVVAGSGAFDLHVFGIGFGPNSVVRWDGGTAATTQPSDVRLVASIPASYVTAPGTHTITVYCQSNGLVSDNSATFTVANGGPTLDSISPSKKMVGSAGFTLTATGSGFVSGSTVRWNGSNRSTSYVSSTTLSASIPASDLTAVGTAQVTVFNPAPGGGTSAVKTFTITANEAFHTINFDSSYRPVRIALSKADRNGNKDGDTSFFRQFNHGDSFTATASAIAGNGSSFQYWTQDGQFFTSSRTASIVVDNYYDMVAVYQDPDPVITSITPTQKEVYDPAFTITVRGSMFNSSTLVRWRDDPMTTRFINETMLEADIPADRLLHALPDPGAWVYVNKPGIGNSNTKYVTLHNPAPILAGMSPSSVEAGSTGFTLAVAGDKFIVGGGTDVQWDGVSMPTNVISRSAALVNVPASYVASAGTHQIRVVTGVPGGGTSTELTFTVTNPAPSISSISPWTVVEGSAGFDLVVDGQGFVSSSTVRWNGSVRSTTYIGGTRLVAQIPASDIAARGTYSVTVVNDTPGGGVSNAAPFVVRPVARTLTIQSSNPNSGVTIDASWDNNGNGAGTTTFSRVYDDGSNAVLTAPASAPGGNVFQKWLLNGQDFAATQTVVMPVSGDANLTAVYDVQCWTLTVASRNPDSGVTIGMTTDRFGLGSGTTTFTRSYYDGTHVSVNPPGQVGSKLFDHLEVDGAPINGPLIMDADHTVTAVYVNGYSVAVSSSNPNAGVPIQVWNADFYNRRDGNTAFSRIYKEGRTVAMTAPASAGGNWFDYWQVDGVRVPGTSRTITLTMNQAHTAKAVFATNRTLTVRSTNPTTGVPITVWLADKLNQKNGVTEFIRQYAQGASVPLTAPQTVGTSYFQRWDLNGSPWQATGTVTVPMSANQILTAVYAVGQTVTVTSSEAAVPITVWIRDRAGLGNGTTSFTRLYPTNTLVSFTCPATANGKAFVRWEKDGVAVPGTSRTLKFSTDTPHTVRAVYSQ